MKPTVKTSVSVCVLLATAGCQDSARVGTAPVAAADPAPAKTAPSTVSPGKLSAPISLDYSITGNPVVGQPVAVNVEVSSPLSDRAITLHYRMNEVGSMTFPESQAESMALAPLASSELRSQQLTLVPQREGRLFIVVSAEIETDSGTMMKSMSIPIQVGRATTLPDNGGELVEGTDGETGLSMPATEPQ